MSSDKVVRNIKRITRKKYSSEKISQGVGLSQHKAWKLFSTMSSEDVKELIDRAITKTGVD